MAVWDQLTNYTNLDLSFSTDIFVNASVTGSTLSPASGSTWTDDPTVAGAAGSAAGQVFVSIPDAAADASGILEFDITQANGAVETIFGQVIGWNSGLIAFQAFSSYADGVASGAVPGISDFFMSTAALGAGAVPADTTIGTGTTNVPSFLDPEMGTTTPLLLNNSGAVTSDGTTVEPSLVGQSLSGDNVSVIGAITQDPNSLAISAVAGNSLTSTFAALGNSNISVINAFNNTQVVELQYTNASGTTVDVYGKLLGSYSDHTAGDGALLFQVYSDYNQATGALSQTAADANMPYLLISQQSLAASGGMPATGPGGNENNFNTTANPTETATGSSNTTVPPFGLGGDLLNLSDLLGQTFTSDHFLSATQTYSAGQGAWSLTFGTFNDWTTSTDPDVGGNGTVEQVSVAAVFEQYQVVEFNISRPDGTTQTIYGQLFGQNSQELGFVAYTGFNASNGVLSGPLNNPSNDGTGFVLAAETGLVSTGFNNDSVLFGAGTEENAPLFINPSTPSTDLDLSALAGQSFSADDVAGISAVEQDPTTLMFSALDTGLNAASGSPNSVIEAYGAGAFQITNVYNDPQIVELQYVTSAGVQLDLDARVIGYNADNLLLQTLGQVGDGAYDPTTGAWNPANWNPGSGDLSDPQQSGPPGLSPFFVISDASLAGSNGLPADDVFGANPNFFTPLGTSQLCFCAGTLIATPDGEVEVEKLAVGGSVLTLRGETRRIVWIGHGQVMVTRGHRSAATPVIVRKNALGNNIPHRDLHVTKGHSLFVDDVLIPVEFLVNHRSILWNDMAQEVSIYHIELDTHDVLIANGAPAESYRDDGNRWLFHNANSGWALSPKPPCAPVLTGGAVVDAVWSRLLDRAGPRRNLPLTDDADLHVWIDGRRIDAHVADGGLRVFQLPASAGSARLLSRSVVPAELGLARDPRELGVPVARIILRRGAWSRTMEAADPALTQGFHHVETDLGVRWTNGDAQMPEALFAGAAGKGQLELVVMLGRCATQYVDDGEGVIRAA